MYFFDAFRVLAMLCVIIYHAVASYSTVVPYWDLHDPATDVSADIIRILFDVFMMPIFFFIAGYFGIKSLQKHGDRKFLKSKFRRLMLYWIFIVLIIIPFAVWRGNDYYSVRFDNYWHFWIFYLFSFGIITLGPIGTTSIPGTIYPLHFWYISLLFYFFIGLYLVYMVKEKFFKSSSNPGLSEQPSGKSIAKVLLLFGIITSIGYFVMLLLVADIYWLTINHVTQCR